MCNLPEKNTENGIILEDYIYTIDIANVERAFPSLDYYFNQHRKLEKQHNLKNNKACALMC